jgi:hypothetical protein
MSLQRLISFCPRDERITLNPALPLTNWSWGNHLVSLCLSFLRVVFAYKVDERIRCYSVSFDGYDDGDNDGGEGEKKKKTRRNCLERNSQKEILLKREKAREVIESPIQLVLSK